MNSLMRDCWEEERIWYCGTCLVDSDSYASSEDDSSSSYGSEEILRQIEVVLAREDMLQAI